jgi:hypothetical protein
MTVVLEDQVKTIAAELKERFGPDCFFGYIELEHRYMDLEDLVRAVIAMYDISDVGRPVEPFLDEKLRSALARASAWATKR